jgi:hypothetical protein
MARVDRTGLGAQTKPIRLQGHVVHHFPVADIYWQA